MKKKMGIYGIGACVLLALCALIFNGQGKKETTANVESAIPENTISENTVSENAISENTISENTISGNTVSEEEYEYANFAFADVSDYVNVRNQPSTEGEIVGKIYDGAVAEILSIAGENDDWYQIVSGNVEGYIKAEFFLRGEEAADVMDKYVTRYAEVRADRLNVRKEPSVDSQRVGYVTQGEKIKVVEVGEEWVQVQYTENILK